MMLDNKINIELLKLIRKENKNYEVNTYDSLKCFTNVNDEIFSLYNGVGIRVENSSSFLELSGNDCLDFLHRITTNSILKINEGSLVKTIFTNEKGRIVGIADVMKFENKIWLKTDEFFKEKIIAWINKYVISDDVNVKDISDEFTAINIYGPQRLTFAEWLLEIENLISESNLIKKISINNTELLILFRNDKLDSNCFSIVVNNSNIIDLIDYILEHKGPFNLNLIGSEAFESYRIEQGIPSPEKEINDQFNPHELYLSELIDTKKGCYIGQEVLARLETYDKVQKKITGFELTDNFELNSAIEIFSDNEQAGFLTSKTYSYKLKKFIGLGLLKVKYFNSNSELYLINNENKIKLITHNLPFIKTIR